ncbi:MAG: hypothetical protein PVJ57_10880 [Phycisphaerae bacterium]
MTAASGRTARARRWWRWVLRLVVIALLLACFGRYAYLRLTVDPPLSVWAVFSNATNPGPSKPNDVTAELTEVLLPLTQLVPLTLPPPPEGMEWTWHRRGPLTCLEIRDAVRGEWTPASRPQLQAVIAHLEDNLTGLRILNLHALRGRPWQFDFDNSIQPNYRGITWSNRRYPVQLLVADARYQHAQRGDLAAAWRDLQTALWLARPEEEETAFTVIMRRAPVHIVLTELRHMSREYMLDAALVAEIDATLRQWPPLDETWQAAVAGEEANVQHTIDACFTLDENGQGWCVPSRQSDPRLTWVARPVCGAFAQHPLWNLASVIYNDRRSVEAKRAAYFDAMRRLVDLSYADVLVELDRLGTPPRPFCPVDGVALNTIDMHHLRDAYGQLLATYAAIDATRLMLALCRFKGERGVYPETLGELVPMYISDQPLDPFANAPFTYRRDGDGYVLYSRGSDGIDDGGVTLRPGRPSFRDPDYVYSYGRPDPAFEPELVPIGTGTPGKP